MALLSAFMYRIGFMIRETGQALDRVGLRIQGNEVFKEQIWRHRSIMNLSVKKPEVPADAFVAPSAAVIGNVKMGPGASVWYHSVIRADEAPITIGARSNVQDGSIITSVATDLDEHARGSVIGDDVTIGHFATINGATIEDLALIGMGATLQEGVTVERGAMVAAGAVVPPGTRIPAGQLWGGNPARLLRQLKPEETSFLPVSAQKYAELAKVHKAEIEKPLA